MIQTRMELDYVVLLCNNILENNNISNLFNKFKLENNPDHDFEFYYDKKLIEFMINVLQLGESFNYSWNNQLDSLFYYIYNVLHNYNVKEFSEYKKIVLENEESKILKEITDYVFEDSFLLKFEVDYEERICKCFFSNVLIYGNKRNDLSKEVEVDNLMLHFTGVEDFKIKGSLNFTHLQGPCVYSCKYYKVSDELYHFVILCTLNWELVLFRTTFSSVNAVRFVYNKTNYQIKM